MGGDQWTNRQKTKRYYYSLFFEQENENSYVNLSFIRGFNYLTMIMIMAIKKSTLWGIRENKL